MEGDCQKQDRQNDKDVFFSRLLENYDGNINVPPMFKDSASWYDNKWGKIAYLLNDGANHDRIKSALLLRNLKNFHEQVLHEHEMSNNDISLKYIKNEIIKQKHTIEKISESAQNIDIAQNIGIAHKYENEIHERNKISESNIKNYELDIEKMRSCLLEKEKQKFNIAEQHQEIVKIFGECNEVIKEYFNFESTMVEKVCELSMMYNINTITYDNCLRDIKCININSDRSMIVKGYDTKHTNKEDSLLNLQMQQQQQQQDNNDIVTIMQEDAYYVEVDIKINTNDMSKIMVFNFDIWTSGISISSSNNYNESPVPITGVFIKIDFEINVQGWNNGNLNYDEYG